MHISSLGINLDFLATGGGISRGIVDPDASLEDRNQIAS